MASTALPHTTHSQETLQRQYMTATAASPEQDEVTVNQTAPSPPPPSVHQTPVPTVVSSENSLNNAMGGNDSYPNPYRSQVPDPYQYTEASVTSGSNSGEEDDRIDLGNSVNLFAHSQQGWLDSHTS